MKDEEIAEEYAEKECCTTCKNINHSCKEKCECWTFAKKGFLAGLKAGRPQWHDLRKDPNDLPKKKQRICCKGKRIRWYICLYWQILGKRKNVYRFLSERIRCYQVEGD